ncbi:MAG: hypothetical protein HKM99_10365 [Flavobacteriaceae bacterium]|nr:hypothetical protein [Flavobacteriaceae bacterium]
MKYQEYIKPLATDDSHPSIRFIPDKKDHTNGELLVYDAKGELKFMTKVYQFNPMELGMTHYCTDKKMEHCIPSDHLCDDDMIEVWI